MPLQPVDQMCEVPAGGVRSRNQMWVCSALGHVACHTVFRLASLYAQWFQQECCVPVGLLPGCRQPASL